MSETLRSILDNWFGDPTKVESPIDLPFDVENFCHENDAKLDSQLAENVELKRQLEYMNQNCISIGLHNSRMEAREMELEKAQKEREDLKLALADRSEKYKLFIDKGLDQLHTENKRLREALEMHHQWHQDVGVVKLVPGDIELNLSLEYTDSTLCEKTMEALQSAKVRE